ncbi:MAG: hypothetical protein SFY68_15585 [Candidatus Sumerlaeia bacterium]|nr:hypothetical protein [Candidatus Sumerlaeia bacterium]
MNPNDALLTIRFEGSAVGASRIPVELLIEFLTNFNKAVLRTGMVLTGEADSLRRGARGKTNKQAIALDLVFLTHGSPVAVLGFERRIPAKNFFDTEFGENFAELALTTALDCLEGIQKEGYSPPQGCDTGVVMAWRDAGLLFNKDVTKIQLELNHRPIRKVVTFTQSGMDNIQRRIHGSVKNIRTIEGRLLMADFKEHGTRCRIHPSIGEPVLCLFDSPRKDEVLENILQYVRVMGEAIEDPKTRRITSIQILDIQRIEDKIDNSLGLLPQGSPLPFDFWNSPNIDELAAQQNVQPLSNIEALFGTWPGELDDGFEAAIDELRHPSAVEG